MALSANLLAALQANPGNYWLIELATPGGNKRYASQGYASAGSGHFGGLVLAWGTIRYELSDRSGIMCAAVTEIEIDDTSRTWAQLVEGSSADSVAGSAVTLFRAHPDCAEADWYTAFAGEIDSWEWVGPFRTRVRLRTADGPLRRPAPRAAWLITPVEFPDAHIDSLGQLAPIIYGHHDSSAHSNDGMVPCLRVGVGEYLVSAGWLKSVDVVYTDGVVVSVSGYTVAHPMIGGRQFTRIDYVSDPGEDAVVTADVQGYEATGDGSGALIEDPLDELAHFVTNFVIGDYASGNWLATNAIIDAASFAGTFFSDRDYSSSFHLAERRKGYDILAEWAVTTEARLYWTPGGKIAAKVEDPTETSIYPASPWFVPADLLEWRIVRDDRGRATSVAVEYVPDAVAGVYRQTLEVCEPDLADDYPEAIAHAWSSAQ